MGNVRGQNGGILQGVLIGITLGTIGLGGYALYGTFANDRIEATPAAQRAATTARVAEVYPAEPILNRHLDALRKRSLLPTDQAVLVETLSGEVLMAHNTERAINPASVLKLAPTLMAIERFGPDYRFRTVFLADGPVEDGVLEGTLAVRSDGDPTFGREDVNALADELRRRGVRSVRGDLLVAGQFSFHTTDEPAQAVTRFRESLARAGIRVGGVARLAPSVAGGEIFALESEPLIEIVQRLNSHSVNRTGDNLGTTVGGPAAIERYFVEHLEVRPDEIEVHQASGLGHNAMTANAAMRMLRRLYEVLDANGLELDQVLPLNGVGDGTMRRRLVSDGLAGSVAAKTGTHYTTDGGVTTLTGVAYTRERGPVLFVVLNSRGPVEEYRDWQDELLADLMTELGGANPPPHALAAIAERSKPPAPPAAKKDPFDDRLGD